MNTDVRKWTRSCIQCQLAKVQQDTVSPHSTFTTPDARFDYIHIDIVGPLPPSNGYSYISLVLTGSHAGQRLYP